MYSATPPPELDDRLPQPIVKWQLQSSHWKPLCHPRVQEVSIEVDNYFLLHWNFPSVKAERQFLKVGFSRVTCLYFPKAMDDRIHFACRLLTVLFLIDDLLEDMSFADGKAYNDKLIPISRGDVLPDRSIPAELILYDLWESMRECDKELADEILEPTFEFMRAQTDNVRLNITELGQYLKYREKDVGQGLLAALMRFTMGLRLSDDELLSVSHIEKNVSMHISIVNDIYSWKKELLSSELSKEEGSVLCSAVKVMAEETNLSIEAGIRILWYMVREWELVHDQLCDERVNSQDGCSRPLREYMKGLEYQMSGNELWSATTPRYGNVGAA